MGKIQINYKSDFKLFEERDGGKGFDVPFVFRYSTLAGSGYECSHVDGEYHNCKPLDDGRLMVIFDNHGLPAGQLVCERHFYLTDKDYHDGICDLWDKRAVDVFLGTGATEDTDIEVVLPPYYSQGEPGKAFTYEDFTPEQIAELQQPATEAAEEANTAAKSATDAAQAANEIAQTVAQNNTQWAKAEQARETAEVKRQTDTQQAITDANTARNEANAAAGKAETAATEATEATKKANNAAAVAAQSKELLFRDLWNEACGIYGTYNDKTGFYELNGLTDITYEDAVAIFYYTAFMHSDETSLISLKPLDFQSSKGKVRTNLPFIYFNRIYGFSFYLGEKLEVVNIKPINEFGYSETGIIINKFSSDHFYYCMNLREVQGVINFSRIGKNGYSYTLPLLSDIYIKEVHEDFAFLELAPLIKLDSLSYLVNNATNSKAITIKVHPEVYAKLTDEGNAEWYAVNTAAQAKQISFATQEQAQAARTALAAVDTAVEVWGDELLAPAGKFLTQAADVPIMERLFLSRRIALPGEAAGSWRLATDEEVTARVQMLSRAPHYEGEA